MEGRRLLEAFRSLIPAVSYTSYKGQSGKIGVIGGSEEYTGAPYFAAMSAMRAGGDLSHVFCPVSAAGVIKSYSPDLIVHPLLSSNSIESVPQISSWFSRLHAIVIGPGLGRNEGCIETAKGLIWSAVMQQKPLVIDADGLFLLCQEPELVRGYERAILTPNMVEFQRLYKSVFKEDIPNSQTTEQVVQSLSSSLGNVTIVLKGQEDIISNGMNGVVKCTQKGSPRRCGGQGDLLSGVLTLFLYWATHNKSVHMSSLFQWCLLELKGICSVAQ
jgi:ATP-dependent NAD(P)H-hydrate dehydratase